MKLEIPNYSYCDKPISGLFFIDGKLKEIQYSFCYLPTNHKCECLGSVEK